MDETIISDFIENQFPQIYREEGPFFIEFVKQYFNWLETDPLSPVYNARRQLTNIDIDTTTDNFLIYFKEKYLKNIQLNTATDTKRLIKNALDLYRSKGSENAIRLFFDLVFSAESSVYYPSTDVFRASSAQWTIPYYLEVTATPVNRLLVGQAIQGVTSGATAFVEKLVRRKIKNYFVEVLYISAITGSFQTGEIVKISGDTTTPLSTFPSILGSLTTLSVSDGGTGFSPGDIVTLESRTGSEATGLVTDLNVITGTVNFDLEDGGWGYSSYSNLFVSDKVLLLSNAHIVSTANTTLDGQIINIYQPMANVQWYNNTAFFATGEVVYNYYANGLLIGTNTILSAEYGTNTTTNFFLLNTTSGNNYMDPTAPYYYTAGNTASFQVQNAGWANETANGVVVGTSSNVTIYCTGNISSFSVGDDAYQISTNNVIYANSTVSSVSPITSNTFQLEVKNRSGLFLTNQPLYSDGSGKSVGILSVSYDIGVTSISGNFSTANGNILFDTANNSQWNASIHQISFGSGANASFDSTNLLYPETVSINTNFVRDHTDVTNPANWVNAASYGANLNLANLTNMSLANAFQYQTMTLGSIARLTNQNPGEGYSYAPFVEVVDPYIAPMAKMDFVIRYNSTTGIFVEGEEITQSVNNMKGIVKFSNTSEVHIKRLMFEDGWVAGNSSNGYLLVGVSSGHQAYPTEVTSDTVGIAGEDAVISTNVASSNSAVSNIKVTDSGFSFRDGDDVTFTSMDGERSGSARASVLTAGHGGGFYKTTSGFLSSNKYLYDGEYYQDFSYEIRSPVTVESYVDMLKTVLHVSGTQVFSALVKNDLTDASSSLKESDATSAVEIPLNWSTPTISSEVDPTTKMLTLYVSNTGAWSGAPTSYSYEWVRNSSNVSSNSTYAINFGDVGDDFTCLITAINSAGNSTPVSSNRVGPVKTMSNMAVSPSYPQTIIQNGGNRQWVGPNGVLVAERAFSLS